MLLKKENKDPSNAPNPENHDPHQSHGSCCHPPAKAPTQQPVKNQHYSKGNPSAKTKVTIKFDSGFQNQLFIRGHGGNLSWDKGQMLKNVKPDEWIWETDANFSECEFKVLINDQHYEQGNNHFLSHGSTLIYTPHF